jgi:hypothetical protein
LKPSRFRKKIAASSVPVLGQCAAGRRGPSLIYVKLYESY